MKYVLLGNKLDKRNEREVTEEEAKIWANENGMLGYVEASAKYGANVNTIFEIPLEHIIKDITSGKIMQEDSAIYGVRYQSEIGTENPFCATNGKKSGDAGANSTKNLNKSNVTVKNDRHNGSDCAGKCLC